MDGLRVVAVITNEIELSDDKRLAIYSSMLYTKMSATNRNGEVTERSVKS